MPIQGPTSYFTVVPIFINHWKDANTANGGVAITLSKQETGTATDTTVADLETLFASLELLRNNVENAAQNVGIQSAVVTGMKQFMLAKMNDFNKKMRADYASSPYGRNLSDVPQISAGRDAFMRPLRDTNRLWEKVNQWLTSQGKPALKLIGDYEWGPFNSALDALRVAWNDWEEQEQNWSLDIQKRNDMQDVIYPILKVYRLKIPAVFPENSAIVDTLPLLTPVSGSTPQAPGLTGGWSVPNNRAELSGTASPTAAVTRYQLRACIGPVHNDDLESVVATVDAGEPLTFNTTWGLTTPGSVASFRLVAMTADGHERGSAPVVIARPL
jgi:hypothetical protein